MLESGKYAYVSIGGAAQAKVYPYQEGYADAGGRQSQAHRLGGEERLYRLQ